MMADIEKVIKGLEHCVGYSNSCFECPYSEDGYSASVHCKVQVDRDALELLKEQDAKKVLQIRNVVYRTIGYCPSCGRGLDSYEDGNSGDHITNYCYNCGQAVKWE